MLRIVPEDVKVPVRHQYMLGAISPRPIAFVSTMDAQGNPNLAPYSFFNAVGSNPPTVIFSPALGGRDGKVKDTLLNLRETGEAVINIVNFQMVQQMSLASSPYEKGISEFEKSGLTPIASELVKPFRVAESHVHLECKVKDIIATGTQGSAGNIVIAEIILMHVDEDVLDDEGRIDPFKMDYVARMGGNYYTRVIPDSIFELVQPKSTCGLGVDELPEHIRMSSRLTGNHLGALGNFLSHPNQADIQELLSEHPEWKNPSDKEELAITLLDLGQAWEAFCILVA